MLFHTGISVSKESEHDVFVAAVTWYKQGDPPFVTRGMTFPYIKENLLSVIVVTNINLTETVNAACQRTIEQLLIRRCIKPGKQLPIELLVKPFLAKEHFMLPSRRKKSHWLLNAADCTLEAWLRGER
jgi:hypothetical protein